MKKMKALFLALALMFTVGVTATVAGCKKNEGNESSSVEEGFGNSEESLAKHTELNKYVDLFLVDIKHIDDEKHKALTGVSNKNNSVSFAEAIKKQLNQ